MKVKKEKRKKNTVRELEGAENSFLTLCERRSFTPKSFHCNGPDAGNPFHSDRPDSPPKGRTHLPSQTDGERERVNEGGDAGRTSPILIYVVSEPLTHARVTAAPRSVCVFVLLRKGVCRLATMSRSEDS